MPLANWLFSDRPEFEAEFDQFPAMRPIVERFRDSTRLSDGHGIEAELEKLRKEAENDPVRSVQLNAVLFYLHAIIQKAEAQWSKMTSGVSNYSELLDRLRHIRSSSGEAIRVITFNYDTLIDTAFTDALRIDVHGDPFLESYVDRKGHEHAAPRSRSIRPYPPSHGEPDANAQHCRCQAALGSEPLRI
jgi:hypothetical protein